MFIKSNHAFLDSNSREIFRIDVMWTMNARGAIAD